MEELHGWKRIASYLDVTEKTARRYADELEAPVYKVGGRYMARTEELDLWKHSQRNRPKRLRRRTVILVSAATTLAVLATATRKMPAPATAVLRGNQLQAFNASGHLLWATEMAGIYTASVQAGNSPLVADVDGDGRKEVLLDYHPLPERSESGKLLCFESDGSVRWEFSYGEELTIGSRYFEPYYIGRHLVPLPSASYLLLVAHHSSWYPARAMLLEPASGNLVADYWHPGYIEAVATFDVDGDAIPELLLGGVNNPGPGLGRPSLAVLDVPFDKPVAGSGNFFGPRNGRELSYLLFPRLDVFAAQNWPAAVRAIHAQGDDRLRVSIATQEGSDIIYYLDRRLRVLDVRPSDSLVNRHDGLLDHPYQPDEVVEWQSVLHLASAPDGNAAPTVREKAGNTGRNR